MSADRLREAVRVLRERAEAATPGPWEVIWDAVAFVHVVPDPHTGEPMQEPEKIADCAERDRAYIAMMHPGVGLALADWLDTAAANAERNGWMPGYLESMREASAMRIADLILGGGQR